TRIFLARATAMIVYNRFHGASIACVINVTLCASCGMQRRVPDALLRKVTGKRTAFAFRTLHVEPTAMALQRMLHDREPQPRSTAVAGAPRINPIKTLRQTRNVFGGNPDTAIDHRKVRTF